MILAFQLIVPGKNYILTRKVSSLRGRKLLADGDVFYCWSDGWRAHIKVQEVSSDQARRMRAISDGFGGYEWMLQRLLDCPDIPANHQLNEIC